MNCRPPILLVLTTLLALPLFTLYAQTRISPENPNWQWLRPWGEMHGLLQCQPNKAELWGQNISPIGDANHDRLIDFVVERDRCDTLCDHFGVLHVPHEVYLYYGKRAKLPAVESGIRIGPMEIGAQTQFLCYGDWDGDGNTDLATRLGLYNDTRFGNTQGWFIGSVVVWWGNVQGGFSISDTSHLSCGADAWGSANESFGADMDGDGIQDLCILDAYGQAVQAGKIVSVPKLKIYRGHRGERWGRNGIGNTADWTMWYPPTGSTVAIDQDCDGIMDIAFHQQGGGGQGVAVMYGRHGQLPDTTAIESVRYYGNDIHGVYGIFTDLTGDGVAELAVKGDSELVRVYAGRPGQRLIEQLNNGFTATADAAHPYTRPWATIWMPNRLHDGWTLASDQLLPLGDANGDGINDLWTISVPFIICYSSGVMLDSLIEAELDMRDNGGYIRGVVLGDIDGSGKKTYAMELGYHVLFFRPNEEIPTAGIYRQLPHPEGFRCEHAPASVQKQPEHTDATPGLEIIPNPAHGEATVRWRPVATATTLVISTVDGRELRRAEPAPQVAEYAIATDALAPGRYFITLTSQDTTRTSTLVIP